MPYVSKLLILRPSLYQEKDKPRGFDPSDQEY